MIKVNGVVFSPEDFLTLSHLIATVCADKNCINEIEAINAWFYNHQNICKHKLKFKMEALSKQEINFGHRQKAGY